MTDEQISAHMGWYAGYMTSLGRDDFAARIRTLVAAAIAAEREACAELCDQRERDPPDDEAPLVWLRAAEAIRMRSNVGADRHVTCAAKRQRSVACPRRATS